MANPPSPQAHTLLLTPFTKSLLAGGLAGTTVDLSLYPIDTLKTRLQTSSGFFAAGGFRGVYRGVGSALVGSAPGAALFFAVYDGTKRALAARRAPAPAYSAEGRRYGAPDASAAAEPLGHMLAASAGEVAACAVRVPTEVVKQRAQARQYDRSVDALAAIVRQYRSIGVVGVWRELYRGWSVTIMREVPFTIIQFPLWEGLKKWAASRKGDTRLVLDRRKGGSTPEGVTALESAVFGSVAGAMAAGLTTPLDVLKTRLMLAREKVSALEMLSRILRDSGPRAFFAGIGPRVLWISAGGAIFLGSYQWAINALGGVDGSDYA